MFVFDKDQRKSCFNQKLVEECHTNVNNSEVDTSNSELNKKNKKDDKIPHEFSMSRRVTKSFSEKNTIYFTFDKDSIENKAQLKQFPNNRISTTK